ncbi:hypothetical protein IB642_02980 [Allofrancisella guangzhouensis]|uniref:Uncharacterized protein n=1 Tax=Allofrancisella guangzhouensis TaxID=594679 RepID=A0A0A8E660_9GAMM|nr:hypothetical protein [Allofrancisella guangzhouensis]AJC49493.1 hypothetical protein SD28_07660 [Allofrancisella guangzhouensis]MBK2027967.1 hypothetical protein [Allofrancisella guangzhouensis]MBK2043981.1 hypothetical protein [Allofrancisella guangzhouensis]MBK2045903.1 hypothetical protein [Allofrancisella guangzhouensis]
MLKEMFFISFGVLVISSCTVKEDIQDNIDHYNRLTRDQNIKEINFDKYTNTVEGMRFLVANYPDQVISLDGEGFDDRYSKLVGYLKHEGYTIVVDEKLPATATIIAEVSKPMPDVHYVGILMEQNSRAKQTKYSIVYGDNNFLARKFYNDYKRTL